MRLYEWEGKQLLAHSGIATPKTLQRASLDALSPWSEPCVLKAQTLFGDRKRQGLIQLARTAEEWSTAQEHLRQAFAALHLDAHHTDIVVEELVPYTQELYLALRYDTHTRRPVLMFQAEGGSGVEGRQDAMQVIPLMNPEQPELPALHASIAPDWLRQLYTLFRETDALLLEINPLVIVHDSLMALDAKVELENTAEFRHTEWADRYPPRTLFARQPTANELRAKEVNAMDHRGVAGASYFDYDGTIGILASGGGASLLAMDALMATPLRPANYTEYSGNPTREKVRALSEIVVTKPNLEGLWVIGGHANFTDIYETLMGVMDAVESAQLPVGFPIVMRRGGPRQEEAFAALRERAEKLGLNIQLFSSEYPLTDTVHVLEQAVAEFRKRYHVHSA